VRSREGIELIVELYTLKNLVDIIEGKASRDSTRYIENSSLFLVVI
jgi:hypothetical protein